MADIHGSPGDPGLQMPQAANPGTAPVPYGGPDLQPEPPEYGVSMGPMSDAAGYVMHAIPPAGVPESPSAHDLSAGTVDAPYFAGQLDPIFAAGDSDPGGVSDVSGTVEGAVANATARWQNLQGDVGAGSVIGDLMQFPPVGEDPGAGVGNTMPTAGFYDPPRGYGGTSGAPAYGSNTGNEPPPPPGQQGAPQ